jgi:hypothetical protein
VNGSTAVEMLDAVRCRMSAAVAAQEPAEVVHDLMLDVAALFDVLGFDAAGVRRTAGTLVPMFGLHAQHERAGLPWWRRRRYQAPDYAARAQAYREGVHRE